MRRGRPCAATGSRRGRSPFGEAGALGHRAAQKPPLPYLFERDSGMQSSWITTLPPERQYSFIGAQSYMNNGGYLRDHVLIGRYCSIGRRVTIGAGMHGLSTSPSLARRMEAPEEGALRLSQRRPVFTVIESDVWIGDGAVILPGVRLGAGCVIGANSVVTRDAVPYGVLAGAPARLLRRRFDDATCEALLASRWWDRPHGWLKALPLHDIGRVLDRLSAAPPEEVAPYEAFAVPAA